MSARTHEDRATVVRTTHVRYDNCDCTRVDRGAGWRCTQKEAGPNNPHCWPSQRARTTTAPSVQLRYLPLNMGKGRKIVQKAAPVGASEDLFLGDLDVDESSSDDMYTQVNELDVDSEADHEPTPPIPSKRVAADCVDDDDETQMESLDIIQDSQEQSQHPPKSKRKRNYHIIPDDKKVSVVEWYKKQEFLYNRCGPTETETGKPRHGRTKPAFPSAVSLFLC
ncbi:hypothetical protein E2C01_082284 [Portunus trituberculatus]|uniref:Uncharacterized protein n=1 Tax=Portunus trituberculatus TaxID=210409 RepID=A0A5B7IU48_PORTR|nr:hypothetical protein [Portunus trituberculatus]